MLWSKTTGQVAMPFLACLAHPPMSIPSASLQPPSPSWPCPLCLALLKAPDEGHRRGGRPRRHRRRLDLFVFLVTRRLAEDRSTKRSFGQSPPTSMWSNMHFIVTIEETHVTSEMLDLAVKHLSLGQSFQVPYACVTD